MASPFSIYLYGVYGPGLDWLEESSLTSWTTRFFFPHLLEANKPSVIVVFETSGMILFYTGSLGFALGAFQIYREKLLENKRNITIVYRNIRHPLYRALIISSKGLLFVWPRFFFCIIRHRHSDLYLSYSCQNQKENLLGKISRLR